MKKWVFLVLVLFSCAQETDYLQYEIIGASDPGSDTVITVSNGDGNPVAFSLNETIWTYSFIVEDPAGHYYAEARCDNAWMTNMQIAYPAWTGPHWEVRIYYNSNLVATNVCDAVDNCRADYYK